MANPAFERILKTTGAAIEALGRLSLSDLNSALMEVFRVKSRGRTAAKVMRDYLSNRFVIPSALDPVSFAASEAKLLAIAHAHGFQPLILSPLAPFGTCAISGFADQNKIVTALRGTEVVADATNVLALEAAIRRKENHKTDTDLHLCSSHRHVRGQSFPMGKGFTAHFQVFCAVSAGKDTGSFGFEKRALLKHLELHTAFVLDQTPFRDIRITIKAIREKDVENTMAHTVFAHIESHLRREHVSLAFEDVPVDDHRYYDRLRFSIDVIHGGTTFNIGDGGTVRWAQMLTGNHKERMLTSGIGTELIWKLANGLG
ncbi:MAG TPA: hypothetical protein VEB86_06305 [Chryseosolibacter sp.]|nr:hypothetical protein [Chryseosolibacter sp.]